MSIFETVISLKKDVKNYQKLYQNDTSHYQIRTLPPEKPGTCSAVPMQTSKTLYCQSAASALAASSHSDFIGFFHEK